MTEEERAFLEAYDEHRVRSQLDFYRSRLREYEAADRQAGWVREWLLLAAGTVGVLAASGQEYDVGVMRLDAVALGVIVAVLSSLAILTAGWAQLIGFRLNADLYGAAARGLAHLRPTRPVPERPGDPDQVRAYVDDVESVLLGEVRSWAVKWRERADDDSGS